MIVLDANAAVAMLRATPEGRALKELMLADERVCAPALFLSELGNTLWQYERKGFYTKSDIDQALRTGLNFVDEFFPDGSLLNEALSEAIRCNHPVYDMLYLVLARRNAATLFTLDRKLQQLCADNGVTCVFTDTEF